MDDKLRFADLIGRFYAREYAFPPMAGRLMGFLLVCDPPRQSIAELSDALRASRSAITGAVKMLEERRIVSRWREAGERVDSIEIDPSCLVRPRGFDGGLFHEMAALAREGLTHLDHDAPTQTAMLREAVEFYEFLARRIPALADEWWSQRKSRGE
ncbi:GbsR/MarR family transcriptional regulator [Fodinicola acaciae]|uniref:GbsR/MarR family transcriptional regulator n=1 Tax=Fodinicola acaciae TaxID=2681555 RepID=UPI001FE5E592|nr:MarR family transcriptional regulator [Fodinicola acaciae]